jgi:hypothetical protein
MAHERIERIKPMGVVTAAHGRPCKGDRPTASAPGQERRTQSGGPAHALRRCWLVSILAGISMSSHLIRVYHHWTRSLVGGKGGLCFRLFDTARNGSDGFVTDTVLSGGCTKARRPGGG